MNGRMLSDVERVQMETESVDLAQERIEQKPRDTFAAICERL
jgi:hypothetical protein